MPGDTQSMELITGVLGPENAQVCYWEPHNQIQKYTRTSRMTLSGARITWRQDSVYDPNCSPVSLFLSQFSKLQFTETEAQKCSFCYSQQVAIQKNLELSRLGLIWASQQACLLQRTDSPSLPEL